MKQRAVARRYAVGLGDTAQDSNQLEDYLQKLREFHTLKQSSADLSVALENPVIELEKKYAVLDALLERLSYPEPLIKFIKLLIENDRISLLPEILEAFHQKVNEAANRVTAEIISSVSLKEEQESALQSQIENLTGKQASLSKKVDSGVMGGLCIKIGSRIYDGTIKNQILMMRKKIVEGY